MALAAEDRRVRCLAQARGAIIVSVDADTIVAPDAAWMLVLTGQDLDRRAVNAVSVVPGALGAGAVTCSARWAATPRTPSSRLFRGGAGAVALPNMILRRVTPGLDPPGSLPGLYDLHTAPPRIREARGEPGDA